jgi:D-alanine--poly(phosphoribitol) ligase subunit 1
MPNDVVDLFLARAAENPERLAIVTSRGSISYSRLEHRVRAFAAAFGVRPAPKILIALPPSIDAYACILASGLAGGFHTPVNMASPIEKLRRILRQLQPDVVVGECGMLDLLADAAPNAVRLDPAQLDLAQQLCGSGERHRLAYVFFTSGSTGDPKGVMISRDSLAHYVEWLKSFGIGASDRVSQHPNLAFDISMTDIFGALCYGATLYPLDVEGDRLMPARFVARNGITIWNSTPSVVGLMMQVRQATASNLASVRLFNFCGEPLLKEHLDALFTAVPDAIVQNTYGPTEATVSMTALSMTADSYQRHCSTSVALGNPIAGMEIVLAGGADPNNGEIVIVGPQLADGYWNDPEKTARAFRQVSTSDARRGYFTGDWAVKIDGDLFFKDRMDFQVKVRGIRVELDEVAAAIRACGYPVTCVFKRGEVLVAVVEKTETNAFLDEGALRGRLGQKLEPNVIPERIIMVDRIPRNENDKLDRKAALVLFEANLERSRDG